MRNTVLIFVFISLFAVSATSQRKGSKTKSEPNSKPSPERRSDSIPPDEVLFTWIDYSLPDGFVGWRVVARGAPNNDDIHIIVSYDPERVTQVEGKRIKRAWIKTERLKDGMIELRESYTLDVDEYDCAEKRLRTLERTNYDNKGIVKNSGSGSRQWAYVVPDSVSEAVFGVLCEGKDDQERRDMKKAARHFSWARQLEKTGKISPAIYHYEVALDYAPGNPKILAAIARLKK